MKKSFPKGQSAAEIRDTITDRIIAKLQAGVCPWRAQYSQTNGRPRNAATARPYSGTNWLLLGMSSLLEDVPPLFLTFNQARTLKGHVKSGERGQKVFFWDFSRVKKDMAGEVVLDRRGDPVIQPWVKVSTVFNISQTEGVVLPRRTREMLESKSTDLPESERVSAFEEFVRKCGVPVQERLNLQTPPCYSPSEDVVRMPSFRLWDSSTAYCSTVAHELVHSTGHKSRLDRNLFLQSHKDSAYEELIAELGSAMIAQHFGLDNTENNASYIGSWLQALNNDKSFIFKAAKDSGKAVEWLFKAAGIDQKNEEEDHEEDQVIAQAA